MKGLGIAVLLAVSAAARPAAAHPVPFSYVDIRIQPGALDVTLVAHVFDLGHELGLGSGDRLLDPAVLDGQRAAVVTLVHSRLRLDADDRQLDAIVWSAPEVLGERQSVTLHGRYEMRH